MKRLTFFIVILLLSAGGKSFGAHVMGSDISYKSLGNDSFKVIVNIYRNCNEVKLNNIKLYASCVGGGKIDSAYAMGGIGSGTDITPVCKNSCTQCTSSGCSFQFGIEKYTLNYYLSIKNAPSSCCQIKFFWETCCRDSSFGNSTGFFLEAITDRCLAPENNSPEFLADPFVILCVGKDVVYDPIAIETDEDSAGNEIDSLDFQWMKPLAGFGVYYNYPGYYGFSKPIYFWGFPNSNLPFPRGLYLNNQTGVIKFRPMKQEVAILKYGVREFRNGKLIGEVSRDIMVIVVNCPNNKSPEIIAPPTVNNYFEVCAGDTLKLDFGSRDQNDSVDMSFKQGNLPGNATFYTDSTRNPTGHLSWATDTSMLTGSYSTYTFVISLKDSACPLSGRVEMAYRVRVKPPFKKTYTVSDTSIGCGQANFNLRDTGEVTWFKWTYNGRRMDTSKGFTYNFSSPGIKNYLLQVSNGKCTHNNFRSLEIDTFPYVRVTEDTLICKGEDLIIQAKPKFSSGRTNILWSNSDTNLTTTYRNISKDSIITLAYFNQGCWFFDTIRVLIKENPILELGPDTAVCFGDSFNFRLMNLKKPDPSTNLDRWYVNYYNLPVKKQIMKISDTSNSGNFWTTAGTFSLTITDSFGCTASDTIKVLPRLFGDIGPDRAVCKNLDAVINPLVINPDTGLIYSWTAKFSDGITLTKSGRKDSVLILPNVSRDFQLVLKLEDASCQYFDTANFTVQKRPAAYFSASPKSGNIPLSVSFQDSSSGIYNHVYWNFGDSANTFSTVKNPYFTYRKTGKYDVTLIISDTLTGCSDTLIRVDYIVADQFVGFRRNNINVYAMEIFPNPAGNYINLRLTGNFSADEYILEAIDSRGRNVFTRTVFSPERVVNERVDVAEWSRGLYYISLLGKNGHLISRKLVMIGK